MVEIVAGVAVMVLAHSTTRDLLPWLPPLLQDLNTGIVALALNLLAMAAVSAATQPGAAGE